MIDVIEHGCVRELRFARPPVNALDRGLLMAVSESVAEAQQDGVKALVLSGQPGMFSAGLDIPTLLKLDRDQLKSGLQFFFGAMHSLARSPIPIAAAITGHAPAGGAILAMFCDYRVMADGPFGIGLNEVTIGIPIPEVVAGLAERTIGARLAEWLCVTGELVSPAKALAIGLVDEVVPADETVDRAVSWSTKVAGLPGAAVKASRATVRRDLVELVETKRAGDIARLVDVWFTPEVQEPLREMVRRLREGSSKKRAD